MNSMRMIAIIKAINKYNSALSATHNIGLEAVKV